MASSYLGKGLKRSALTVALGLCFAGGVQAQTNTAGAVVGRAASGDTITVTNQATGFSRTITVDATGSYRFSQLPTGQYQVSRNGGSPRNVTVNVGSAANVDFTGGDATTLDAVTVIGSGAINPIDVSSVESTTILTAEQIAKIPVSRDTTSVALLAPGTVRGDSAFGNLASFGGSSVAENQYFFNGFNITNSFNNLNFAQVPFEAIAEQQTKTGGYGAEFGRSTGGVVNQISRRGTNEFKAGGNIFWSPSGLNATSKSLYLNDGGLVADRSNNTVGTELTSSIWASGALVQDRLFAYGLVQYTDIGESKAMSSSRGFSTVGTNTQPKWLLKMDWNINDSNIIEFTALSDKRKFETDYFSTTYSDAVKPVNPQLGQYKGTAFDERGGDTYIAKYTGYLTDNLSVSAMYGEQSIDLYPNPMMGYDPTKIYVGISSAVVPSAYATITNPQKFGPTFDYAGKDDTKARRFDINYTLGDHDLRAGYDYFEAVSFRGDNVVGPTGYYWSYGLASNPNTALDASHYVGSPASGGNLGTQGYYVTKNYFAHGGYTTVKQQALYIEDRWHITDNLLLSLGLRNDGFTNYNGKGEAYVEQKNNWAPRLGFSWDVNGDSTFKVFGNVGRYHLALPNNVSVRGSNPSLSSAQYFTYTGIAADGTPIGLTQIPYTNANSPYTCANGGMSSNVECGYDKDPRTIAQVDLKPHYQDEFILGMERNESDSFSWGAKATFRDLKNAIDDICPTECFIFNAGTNVATFYEDDGTGNLVKVTHNFEDDFGTAFPKLKRKYAALDMYAQYREGNFFGRVDYTLSHNWGNAEGQLNSSVDTGNGGQGDVSVTQDWDLPELMYGVSGSLPNNRTHQIKAIGSYRFSEEWRVGGSAIVQSGRPRSCYSYWPYAKAGIYNGAYYSFCGVPGAQTGVNNPNVTPDASYTFSPRGSLGETPWTATFNVNLTYTPKWMKGLTLAMDVLNLFDSQTPTGYYERSASSRTTVNPRYGQVLYYTSPRSFRFTARYDF